VSTWPRSRALVAAAASLVLGGVAVAAAPARWDLSAFHAFLLGGALYAGALRRHVAGASAEESGAAFWRGAIARAGAFLLFAGTQAIVCFDLAPGADVRGFFVILSSWIVAETALG
jgi:hypothetical protein